MTEFLQIATTVDRHDDGLRIARALVERRLAACVQVVGPVTSAYRWQGEIQCSHEWLCIAKTDKQHAEEIEKAIRQLHSYDVPEIVATPVVGGDKDYLNWLQSELSG